MAHESGPGIAESERERVFDDRNVLREWFAQLILYSQTMTLSGLYTPFGALGAGALQMLGSTHKRTIDSSDIDELKERAPIWKKEHHPDGRSGWVSGVVPGGDR